MKKVLVIIGLCSLAGYLIFAAFFFSGKPEKDICNHFKIATTSDEGKAMIDLAEIEIMIDLKGLNPYGKPLNEVNTYEIEQVILENKMVKKANVFVSGSNGIRVEIEERQPILRIITNSGEDYYIDKEGKKVPLSKLFVADLPLATGYINEEFAQKDLYNFALFMGEDEFWNKQIEQIVVLPNKELKLIPKVGNHDIILGNLDNFQEKLTKLMTFYQKGLPEVGWNRYSVIDLKYDKQIVGTKH